MAISTLRESRLTDSYFVITRAAVLRYGYFHSCSSCT
jgi:hypothetical protein